MYSSHSIVRVTCLRLSSRRISAQSGSTWRRWPCFVPAAANSAVSSAVSVISAGNGQLNPALASRFKVNRTVDGETPTRRAISLSPTPAVLKRSTSRTWRIVVLSAGIHSPMQKPKERTLIGPAEAPLNRATSSRNGGRNHLGTPSDIKSEWWATSSRIRGRLRPESAGLQAYNNRQRADSLARELPRLKAPRTLTTDNVRDVVARLAKFNGAELFMDANGYDPEARSFADQLFATLTEAGWARMHPSPRPAAKVKHRAIARPGRIASLGASPTAATAIVTTKAGSLSIGSRSIVQTPTRLLSQA